uniref:TF_AP-2 domain-containing protein n=1 Tax=Heterorhabditis bacteriophora TaxID=37862 RepID=A0A1I7XFL4_HETBA
MGHDPRSFNAQYLNIGYGNEFGPTYHPNMIQHHDFCLTNAKSEDLETGMIRKIDVPLFFIGDPTFANSTSIDPREIYCTVPGRTSLLSSTTKYRVTVGEIQRRISPPECLNASLLGGILRKAKSKDGGKTLRDSLRKIGLTLPAGRRKQANVTAWTALVEEEAVHMAKDFAVVCEKEFHAREIGIYLTKANLAIDHDVIKRRTILEHSKKIICELGDLMAADRTPLTSYLATTRQTALLDQGIQQHLSHFTLL